ncbi:hypothetical protein NC651_039782 [Populus alba x Populus x berolinensis]|nr:hypothetical protein NC651_039782 [Populus alba x Populus x berolinensis]
MAGIMHKIEETLHIGGKKEEQKSGKPDEHKGEHKGESHGEKKPEHSGQKEGFLEKIHGDGHGEGEKKKKEKKEKKKKEKKHATLYLCSRRRVGVKDVEILSTSVIWPSLSISIFYGVNPK